MSANSSQVFFLEVLTIPIFLHLAYTKLTLCMRISRVLSTLFLTPVTVAKVTIVYSELKYHSLVKEHPPLKECLPLTFGPISCIGSKFTRMSTELCVIINHIVEEFIEGNYKAALRRRI